MRIMIILHLFMQYIRSSKDVEVPKNISTDDDYFYGEIVFRVVKGVSAKLGEVPYQVALMQRVRGHKYQVFCGGTIIRRNTVMTAAHCLVKDKVSDCRKGTLSRNQLRRMLAVAGQLNSVAVPRKDSIEYGQYRSLSSGRYPTKYKFPKNDIAIVYTNGPFYYNEFVNEIPYATKNVDYGLVPLECTVSGYGRINNVQQSPILQIAKLKTLPRIMCNRIHRRNMDKFICTSDAVSDTHKGDSGGPLLCKDTGDPAERERGVVVGVVSGKDLSQKMSSFFTRVSSHVRFISSANNITPFSVLLIAVILYFIFTLRIF